ncbi:MULTISPECIES: hypothetical protein [unclassified Rhizobium]
MLEVVIPDMATYEATVLRVTRSKSNGPLPLDRAGIP